MKKCVQCGQALSDDTNFCYKCGGGSFEQTEESETYRQPPQQEAPTYQQPVYQQPVYQQPAYQQPAYHQNGNNETVGIGQYILMFFLWWIPAVGWIVGLIYTIIIAIGGSNHKTSYVNFARGLLIWKAIMLVLAILFVILFWSVFASFADSFREGFNSGYYGGYYGQ